MSRFFLSTETVVQLKALPDSPAERWMQIPHTRIVRPAYVLLAGEELTLATTLVVTPFSELFLRVGAAHPNLSSDGASLAVDLLDADGSSFPLVEHFVPKGEDGLQPRALTLELQPYAGMCLTLRLRCLAGPEGDAAGDWLALFDLVVSSSDRRSHTRALAFTLHRTANELGQFESAYDHPIYKPGGSSSQAGNSGPKLVSLHDLPPAAARCSITQAPQIYPLPDEMTPRPTSGYEYADKLLRGNLAITRPAYPDRFRCFGSRPVRVLSLCSGAGRIESDFATKAFQQGLQVDWTLLDINESLLLAAAQRFSVAPPRLIVANVNEIREFGEEFDIIMCVSALHHIVELERVVEFIGNALAPGGEFWSIGEAVGRNGNRLWEDEYLAANAFFNALPERLRLNAGTGACDADLPDIDCSDAAFEGIRSEEILPLLFTRLEPVQTYLYNCFLWRLTNQAYSDNYNLDKPEDVLTLQDAVRAELHHFAKGGRPTALHGIFKRRSGNSKNEKELR